MGHGQKLVWPIWSPDFKTYHIFKKDLTEVTGFFACWYNFTQKWVWSWSKMSMVKNGYGQSGDGTQKLTVFEEWTDGIDKLIFCMLCDHKNWSKADQKNFGCEWSKMGVASQVIGLKMNRWNKIIFACWYEFMKAKSWFNYFGAGVVKNNNSLLVHETLISFVRMNLRIELIFWMLVVIQ